MRFHIPTSALQRRSENPVGKPGRKIRSRRSVLTRCRVLSSRSRSIKPISRFFAIPQVASFAALAIRLSKFILQTHVLVSLPPRYYEQWGTTQPDRNYPARRTALSIYAILFTLRFSPKHIGALRVHELRFKERHSLVQRVSLSGPKSDAQWPRFLLSVFSRKNWKRKPKDPRE